MQNKQRQTLRTYFGYTIIKSVVISSKEEMVLGVKSLNGQTRFKTWKVRNGVYRLGKSFVTEEEALQDFERRVEEWKNDKRALALLWAVW